MLLSAAGSSATVLVALATIGVSPAAMRAGKVSSVPPPAIELTMPASSAAPAPTRSCAAGIEVVERLIFGLAREKSGLAALRPEVRSAAGRSDQGATPAKLRPEVRSAAGRSDHRTERPKRMRPVPAGGTISGVARRMRLVGIPNFASSRYISGSAGQALAD